MNTVAALVILDRIIDLAYLFMGAKKRAKRQQEKQRMASIETELIKGGKDE